MLTERERIKGEGRRTPLFGMAVASFDLKFLKFCVVGAINTLFGLMVYLAVLTLTDSFMIAIVMANLFGPVFNFFSTGRIVFRNKRLILFFPFLIVYIFICAVNIAMVAILRQEMGAELAQVVCLPFIAATSYVLIDRLVFSRPS